MGEDPKPLTKEEREKMREVIPYRFHWTRRDVDSLLATCSALERERDEAREAGAEVANAAAAYVGAVGPPGTNMRHLSAWDRLAASVTRHDLGLPRPGEKDAEIAKLRKDWHANRAEIARLREALGDAHSIACAPYSTDSERYAALGRIRMLGQAVLAPGNRE